MHTYQVHVIHEDRWWMITVPELDSYQGADGAVNVSTTTQARRFSDIAPMARDFIATVTDSAPSAIAMDITVTVNGIDVTGRAGKARHDRELADRYAAAARSESESLARDLASNGIAVRDIGEVLGLSFQRAQQLVAS